jgi:5-methylcytosine-specific restriction endonuclease McrA
MQKVLVLDTNKKPLMPTHPAKARKLLNAGKAAVYCKYPFTIILKYDIVDPKVQPIELKVDPGSKTTGISIVALFKRGYVALWVANLEHRGQVIKLRLEKRSNVRRSRRSRKLRYRKPRFSNRAKPKGWLAPSLLSRVDNVFHWAKKLIDFIPVTQIAVEMVRFDTQKMENPEISGIEYQQGELEGYEVKEYLLEKWGRKCAYCDVENVPLQVEHIQARSKHGSDRVSNLTLACKPCNKRKDNRPVQEFLSHNPVRLKKILAQSKQPLRDAAIMNSIRWRIGDVLKVFGLPITFWSGGRTKFNRVRQGYSKDHWIDATCVGESGEQVYISNDFEPLCIKAMGRGSRQMCKVDKYGFPRTGPKKLKRVKGFQTGDIVKAVVTKGNKAGTYVGRVAIRSRGTFKIGLIDGINWKYCKLLHRTEGYDY